MSSISSTWIVTEQPDMADAAIAAIDSHHRLSPVGVCRDLAELSTHLEHQASPLVVVDIDAQPLRMLAELQPVIDQFAQTRFVVLASEQDSELMLEAMQVGARHFLLKRAIAEELSTVLHRLIKNNGHSRSGDQGAVVTVLSASGGCGATSIAVNLARELQLLDAKSVLLIDLDTRYGAIGCYLGLDGQYSIADVLSYNGPIDHQLISSTSLSSADDLDVLASPAHVDLSNPSALQYDRLGQAIEACREGYGWTIVDAPCASMDVAATLARASHMALIVFQLTVKDIRVVRSMISALTDRGVYLDQIIPVVNRCRRRNHSVSLEEAQRALDGCCALRPISNDFVSAVKSINIGRPLAATAPRSPLRRDVRDLAMELVNSYAKHSPIGI